MNAYPNYKWPSNPKTCLPYTHVYSAKNKDVSFPYAHVLLTPNVIFIKSGFRSAFEEKGRFRDYLTNIPVFLVQRQDLGLIGAVSYLKAEGQSS